MSVRQLIDELSERGLMKDQAMAKLRAQLSKSDLPISAKTLAKYLADKRYLTHRQATELLGVLMLGGVDVDQATPYTPVDDDALSLVSDDEAAAEDAESSSIFAPYLTGKPKPPAAAGKDAAPATRAAASNAAPAPAAGDAPGDKRPAAPPLKTADAAKRGSAPVRAAHSPPAARPGATTGSRTAPATPTELAGFEAEAALRTKKKRAGSHASEWDSPLMLIGGGAFIVLVLAGATIAWLLNWESGDEKLQAAQGAVAAGSYTQAITLYQEFLERFPRHRERSLARVQLAATRIRKATDSANFAAALDIAREELEAIDDEAKLSEIHGDLSALLPQVAAGLAKEAESSTDMAAAMQLVEQSSSALTLVGNTKYIPKSLRVEGDLEVVEETLERVRRRQRSQHDLQEALAAMEQAIAAGDTRAAYARHFVLIKQHPELTADAALVEKLRKTSAAEQAAVRYVAEEKPAETAERPTPWLASLAIGHRRSAAAAAPSAGVHVVRVDGAVYGLDAATGRLLWRRPIGFAAGAWPLRIAGDVLVVDAARHELVRLEAATGRLLWRQAFGEQFAVPLVVDDRGFVAGESGRLYTIDLKRGTRTGFLQFAQPLRVTPVVDRQKQRLYLAGAHSSLYSISLADLACVGVYYLGHAEGSIRVPPLAVSNKLAVIENDGVETSRLHLLAFDEQGAVAQQVAERRLAGLAATPPIVSGRRLIVTTDRGQIEVYEIGAGDDAAALAVVATRDAAHAQPIAHHVAAVGSRVWVGAQQLTKYSILPTGNRLRVDSIENDFRGATFDHPIEVAGETLVQVHRPKGRAGAVIAALDTTAGAVLWETELAVPLAGPAIVDESTKSLVVANAHGSVFRCDEAALRARVQDQPLAAADAVSTDVPYSVAVALGRGRAAFCAPGSQRLLLCDPARGEQAVQTIPLPSSLACEVTPSGDGLIVPLAVGQVLYLAAADGAKLAVPFQPRLAPQTTIAYRPAAVVDPAGPEFVITDGKEKVYLVAKGQQAGSQLIARAEAEVGPYTIDSAWVVLDDVVLAVAGESRLTRFRLPSLEPAGEVVLTAPAVWGPFPAGDGALLATADGQLAMYTGSGDARWRVAVEHGALAGSPLAIAESVLLAYRNGVLERRALADGKVIGQTNVEQALASAPVPFLQRIVVAAHDGTLLFVDQP